MSDSILGFLEYFFLHSSNITLYDAPSCPPIGVIGRYLAAPSTFVMFSITSLVCLLFAILIAILYNSVELLNKKIRTRNISNTMWIFYFATLAASGIVNAIRFSIKYDNTRYIEFISAISLVMNGITTLLLSLTLNYQRKFRCGQPSNGAANMQEFNAVKKKPFERVFRFIFSIEFYMILLLFAYFILTYLRVRLASMNLSEWTRPTMEWVQFLSMIAQRVPSVGLVLIVLSYKMEVGPTRASKITLFIGMLLNFIGDLPVHFWIVKVFGYIPHDWQCIVWLGSGVDLILILNIVSLVFFFAFMRSEFLRNQEDCMYFIVSQSQDNFDFRRFY